jgi:hypothetical protein
LWVSLSSGQKRRKAELASTNPALPNPCNQEENCQKTEERQKGRKADCSCTLLGIVVPLFRTQLARDVRFLRAAEFECSTGDQAAFNDGDGDTLTPIGHGYSIRSTRFLPRGRSPMRRCSPPGSGTSRCRLCRGCADARDPGLPVKPRTGNLPGFDHPVVVMGCTLQETCATGLRTVLGRGSLTTWTGHNGR